MSARTPYKRCKVITSLVPASRTATAQGTGIDTKGWKWLRVKLHLGAWTTDEAITLSLETSRDNGVGDAYAAMVGGPSAGPYAASGSNGDKPKEILLFLPTAVNTERYIRPVVTHTGSGTFIYSVSMEVLDPTDTDLATQTPEAQVVS